MGDGPTETLAGFAATLGCGTVPERVRLFAKGLILDALACALAGHRGEETGQVRALALALAGAEEARVLGGGRLSLAGATLFNGYLITAVTMCDTHRPTLTHVTPEVLPPALAIAERDGLSGADLLAAVVAGCEITTRIGTGLDYPAFRARGWHGPGVIGPFGAAAAVGRLRRLDASAMARAFALAGSQAAGTFAAWGTPTVKFHQCRGALSGLMAALLAEQGFVANPEFLTAADGGLYNTYSNGGRPADALAGLGERWEIEQIALRPWPSASAIQGLITALVDLVAAHDILPEAVRRLRIAVSPQVFDMHGGFARYGAKFEAMLSAHYVAAAILHDRRLTLDQFEPARYDDPALRRFAAERVEVAPEPSLSGVQARVAVETADGASISAGADHPRGAPENPLSFAEVAEKFRAYAAHRLDGGRIAHVIETVAELERLPAARTLLDALACDDGSPA